MAHQTAVTKCLNGHSIVQTSGHSLQYVLQRDYPKKEKHKETRGEDAYLGIPRVAHFKETRVSVVLALVPIENGQRTDKSALPSRDRSHTWG